MRHFVRLSAVLVASLVAAPAFAEINVEGLNAQQLFSVKIGDPIPHVSNNQEVNVVAYNHTTAPTLAGIVINGGATTTTGGTRVVADDAVPVAGGILDEFTFSVVNTNATASFSARPRVRFWEDNGSGAPGAVIGGFSFNPITFAANSVNSYTTGVGLAGNAINVPTGAKWWGLLFDGLNATATVAQLNELGQALLGPDAGDIGTYNPQTYWVATAAGSNLVSNPVGSITGNTLPDSNLLYEWQTVVVPEPTTIGALAGVFALAFGRRRA